MAITITVEQLAAAMRLGATTEETAQATRLLAYATEAIQNHLGTAFNSAPDTAVNEATIRLCAFLYDQPHVSRGGTANAMRNSGAARILLPYRVHRLGVAEATQAARASGSADNPVTNVEVEGTTLTVSFADGTTETATLPSGGGSGIDQTARDSAAAAQSGLTTHEGSPHNMDASARASAMAASMAAMNAQTTADANAAAIAGIPPAYVLPDASDTVKGGVLTVTDAIIDAGTSNSFFAWGISQVTRLINRLIPAWARDDTTPIPADKLTNATGGLTFLSAIPSGTRNLASTWTEIAGASFDAATHFVVGEVWLVRMSGTVNGSTDTGHFQVLLQLRQGDSTELSSTFSLDIGAVDNQAQSLPFILEDVITIADPPADIKARGIASVGSGTASVSNVVLTALRVG